jgi:hypothetical protein
MNFPELSLTPIRKYGILRTIARDSELPRPVLSLS